MRISLNRNVWDETLDRFRFIFDEFEEVIVWVSGGKDSTVVYNIAKIIAKEKNRLPLKVAFIDQESEWEATIDMIRKIMYDKDVYPLWFQIPFKLNNSSSPLNEWLYCWDENNKDNWEREKEPIAIKENRYGTDLFVKLFERIMAVDFKDKRVAAISGIRAEESPGRFTGVTSGGSYKGITWGRKYKNPNHRAFYPIYDWKYTDVWHAIAINNWEYNKIYDYQYRYGLNVKDMRVSSLHHETALKNILYMQEVEPQTYDKLVKRLTGITSVRHIKEQFEIRTLPFMFKDWAEYRDYLLNHLISLERRPVFKAWFDRQDKEFKNHPKYDRICRAQIKAILANDFEGTKLKAISRLYSTKKTRAELKQREAMKNETR